MGADRFVVMYGVRFDFRNDAEAEKFDPPWKAAVRHEKLKLWRGRLTQGIAPYAVVGELIGDFGLEGRDSQLALTDAQFAAISVRTRKKLTAARVPGECSLHLLFEAQQ